MSVFQYASLFVFTTIYLFSFRQAVKSAALWGAFEFGKTGLVHIKILFSSILLILFSLAIYFLFSRIAIALPNTLVGFSIPLVRILIISTVILFLGLFPRVIKHLWSLVVRKKVARGTSVGEPGYGWLNSAMDIDALPHDSYSKQVLVVLGALPMGIFFYMSMTRSIDLSIDLEFLLKLYSSLYVSQFIVLYPISKKRGYYDHQPQWLLSKRMLLTYPSTVLIPMAFGIAISPLILKLTSKLNILIIVPLIIYLVFVTLPFPFYCNQSWLIVARKKRWKTENECPEMYESKGTGFWKFCLSQIGLAWFIYLILYCFTDIGYALMRDRIQQYRF